MEDGEVGRVEEVGLGKCLLKGKSISRKQFVFGGAKVGLNLKRKIGQISY